MKSVIFNDSKFPSLIIGILLANLIVFYIIIFNFFFLAYTEEIIFILFYSEYSSYVLVLILIVITRIMVVSYASYSFFKEWKSQKVISFKGFQFLFGVYFYFIVIYKGLDMIVFITYVGTDFFSIEFVTNMYKVRHIIGALSTLPLLSIGVYLFFFHRNLHKDISERKKIAKQKVILASIIWLGFYLLIIYFAENPVSLLSVIIIFSTVNLLIIWVFFEAYKGKILPEINSLIISIGFTILFIIGYIPSILIFTLLGTTVFGLLIGTIIAEIGGLLAYSVILVGFKTKANYKG